MSQQARVEEVGAPNGIHREALDEQPEIKITEQRRFN